MLNMFQWNGKYELSILVHFFILLIGKMSDILRFNKMTKSNFGS